VVAGLRGEGSVAAFCTTLVGGLLAFLWLNAHPARLFMGNSGSMALGGALGMVALLVQEPLLLLVIGAVFVAEAGSDVLQVASVKLRGRRLFRRAPLHHHFEHLSWPESQIVARFWIVGALGAAAGVGLALAGR